MRRARANRCARRCTFRRRRRSSPITFRAAPVFPATLLLDAQIGIALPLAREAVAARRGHALVPVPHDARQDALVHRARRSVRRSARPRSRARPNGTARVTLSARDADGKSVATARLELARRERAVQESARAASRSPGSASSRRSATTSRPPGTRCCGQERRRADHALRRERLPDAHRRRGEGFRRPRVTRTIASCSSSPTARTASRSPPPSRRSRRRHSPDAQPTRRAGDARSAPA